MTKTIHLAVLIVALLASSASAQVYIRPEHREANYGGSCLHASTVTALRHVNAPKLAHYVRRNFSGGEYHYDLNRRLQRWGVRTVSTMAADKRVLDYAHVHGLTAVISLHRDHSCLFVGFKMRGRVIDRVYVINPNDPNNIENWAYADFWRNWTRNGGEAVVIIPRRVL